MPRLDEEDAARVEAAVTLIWAELGAEVVKEWRVDAARLLAEGGELIITVDQFIETFERQLRAALVEAGVLSVPG